MSTLLILLILLSGADRSVVVTPHNFPTTIDEDSSHKQTRKRSGRGGLFTLLSGLSLAGLGWLFRRKRKRGSGRQAKVVDPARLRTNGILMILIGLAAGIIGLYLFATAVSTAFILAIFGSTSGAGSPGLGVLLFLGGLVLLIVGITKVVKAGRLQRMGN